VIINIFTPEGHQPCGNLHIYTRRSYILVAIYIFTPEGHTAMWQFTYLHQKVIHPCFN